MADADTGTVVWFKSRKRELLAHIRALEDFSTAYALVSRLVEGTDGQDEVSEQVRGALYMSAVVTYARQFLSSNGKFGEKRIYPIRHLKLDTRFDPKIHSHLVDVRNKLIAHDDGEQLPPALRLLNVSIEQSTEAAKPIVATLRSYSLSSANGQKFLKAMQEHLAACVERARTVMHEGLLDYLVQSNLNPEASNKSVESNEPALQHRFTTSGRTNVTETLFNLDQLNAEIVSIPKGNIHNKAYSYRMLTYSVALPKTDFKVGEHEVTFFMENGLFKPGKAREKGLRMPRLVKRLIAWGNKPF
ncbi:hypothetical protein [Bradyrhizobium acaciae]|uniref:hypothetical protein n=1 Tax=Bradyrhizobium acaciae TaxID=2683706 RepID=UPI001E4ECA7B|nr:hypothetical protein [Bradyrhizobium acaciae]MCC8979717.1 hypothetical protein [Bradyrhizobium acaciae]